jgi:phospholipid transport system transporter-binding protein
MSPPAAEPQTQTAGDSGLRLAVAGDGRLALAGSLTFATARAARDLGTRTISAAGSGALEIDCAGVTAADSAGLAVLLDWLRIAKSARRSLRYTHLPAGLVALASIGEVAELLTRGV